ncbi:helix-turn-helix transcriptional regulator [Streptomyces roseoverticillatus]|uniref:helix-turn-helix domain-containing protein n=1 Tax=Streptomyces roseoverticillatus TaxID=66429 RepID=UPI001F1B6A02|nr:helix-turn-helix domain-containing protein [Streptomyces roseoverticillatus]MCF3101006.1 helix-turn-helix transcriptional regulator [Streptomyces roseoverticillatus]
MEGHAEPTFAQLLDHLFKTAHPAGRGPYTNAEVAEGITKAAGVGGKGISASALAQLRSGQKKNPSRSTIQALANFFGVEPSYFFDQAPAAQPRADIAVAAVRRDPAIMYIALGARGLSPASLQMLTAVIEQTRALEGLPAVGCPHDPQ